MLTLRRGEVVNLAEYVPALVSAMHHRLDGLATEYRLLAGSAA
ncbi:hypothetical protein [Rathayibacter sp. AY2B5]|nr:hypothetical protein [Rathayibacter sp. AY2B5]